MCMIKIECKGYLKVRSVGLVCTKAMYEGKEERGEWRGGVEFYVSGGKTFVTRTRQGREATTW